MDKPLLKHWPKHRSKFYPGLLATQWRRSKLKIATRAYSVFSMRVGIQYHAMALDTYADTECSKQARLRERYKNYRDIESSDNVTGWYL